MKRLILIVWIVNIFGILYSQDTIINLKNYSRIKINWQFRDSLLKNVMSQKKLDYWEYRLGFDLDINDCPFDSIGCINSIKFDHNIYYKGLSKNLNDSIELSKINCKSGIWIVPPGGEFFYLIYKNNNRIDSILDSEKLISFLNPIMTPEQASLYLDLKGFILHDYYKINTDSYEFIVLDKDFKDSPMGNKVLLTYKKYYIRIYLNGKIYKKRIGEYKMKISHFIIS